jgi:hypothetical protein
VFEPCLIITAIEHYHEGYEVEFFAGNGATIAVVSVPATAPACGHTTRCSPIERNLILLSIPFV